MKQEQIQYKTTKKINKDVIEEVIKIEEKSGLTPQAIIEKAKNKNNPLHKFFDWNNSSAAEKWRLHQARLLINEIKIVIEEKEYFAFENVKITVDNSEVREYKPIVEIINSEDYRRQIVVKAFKNIKYWQSQYHMYQEFKPIFDAISAVEGKFK